MAKTRTFIVHMTDEQFALTVAAVQRQEEIASELVDLERQSQFVGVPAMNADKVEALEERQLKYRNARIELERRSIKLGEGAFLCHFETGNDAFNGDREAELMRIVDDMASDLGNRMNSGNCYDSNGNKVGSFEFAN